MPIKAYFRGKGVEVMADLKARYGDDKGERVFYATANKRKQNPESSSKKWRYQRKGTK